ncbi:hypothetical protein [Streptomyces sp. NPDC127084]|uniref:hypothetical protein n=1 Tax=Streptomyces sp. NPDC127084 TaxID=3347133 RepID=UPI0036691CE0
MATAWRYVNDTIELLGTSAPSLAEALTRYHGDGYVLLDGTVAETDRVQAEGHYSGKVRREGVNFQVHAALRAPVERTISRIKQWRILRHARISPNRLSSFSAALLTLMIYT